MYVCTYVHIYIFLYIYADKQTVELFEKDETVKFSYTLKQYKQDEIYPQHIFSYYIDKMNLSYLFIKILPFIFFLFILIILL